MKKYCLLLISLGSLATALPSTSPSSKTGPLANRTLKVTTLKGSCVTGSPGSYQGFCLDLLQELSHLLGFDYNLEVFTHGIYGHDNTSTKEWTGAAGVVVRGESDLVLTDLAVTAARAKVLDFTTPFQHNSLVALYKKVGSPVEGFSTIFKPLSGSVWICIGLAFIASLASLKLVARLSPGDEDASNKPEADENSTSGENLSFTNSLWLLARAFALRPSDLRLQSPAPRIIAMAWSLFALLTVIIYTCSLAQSLITTSPPENTLRGLLQRPNIKFGCVRGGFINKFLQTSERPDVQQVWIRLEEGGTSGLTPSVADGIARVKGSDGDYAFIGEDKTLLPAASQDCSLRLTQGFYLRSHAIGVQIGSPLRDELSQGILTLKETGVLYRLESKYWPETVCEASQINQPQIHFSSFLGPLTVLAVGLASAIVVATVKNVMNRRRNLMPFNYENVILS